MEWPQIPAQDHFINYFYEEVDFDLPNPDLYSNWLKSIALKEEKEIQSLSYIFCSDDFLLKKNQDYLKHDTLTDIITFQYAADPLSGDVFISIDRVRENAEKFKVEFTHELKRVMAHGLLHLCGYGDKTKEEKELMRRKEDQSISLFTV